ncbi:MAG: hypothetical protein ACYSWO_03655 [Planctomycetota bacterium]
MTTKPDKEQPVTVEQIEGIVTEAVSDAKALQQSSGSLPKVDQDGHSECPFAEELYAKHEELRKKVQKRLPQLHECLTVVAEQITKYGNDLVVVSTHQDRLNRDRPRAHFSEAEAQLAALYKRYLQLQDRVEQAIHFVNDVLQEASTKRFPGKIPQKWPQSGGVAGASAAQTDPNPVGDGKSGADRELTALFEMKHNTESEDHDDIH